MKHIFNILPAPARLLLGMALLIALSTTALAQTSCIKGNIKDQAGTPLEFATVVVLQDEVVKGGANADENGEFKICPLEPGVYKLKANYAGNKTIMDGITVTLGRDVTLNVVIESQIELNSVTIQDATPVMISGRHGKLRKGKPDSNWIDGNAIAKQAPSDQQTSDSLVEPYNRESYKAIVENRFLDPYKTPQSTFSIDVDVASYANCRRFLQREGRLPEEGSVRLEELINYFEYDYPVPTKKIPFSITTEAGPCPWEPKHQLVLIGLQGYEVPKQDVPACNLVFLVDVSGSMSDSDKLPLLQEALKLLTEQMRPEDRVAIVAYAGEAGLVLPSTSGKEKETIIERLQALESGGSTAGGEGIKLAYKIARQHKIAGGNNRVILCTDGDFNVGVSSEAALVKLIEEERKSGIALSVLGFGTGNYQDAAMEALADNGDGNYAYIDGISEARKVLVDEMSSTLLTIAKDVKIQVEFNPANIKSYRLLGYENRVMENEDFDNDLKDAGELGAGHRVTALYEVELNTGNATGSGDLRYQSSQLSPAARTDEWMLVKLRYKQPGGTSSLLIEQPLRGSDLQGAGSENLRWAAAVAAYGMLLRDSEYKGKADWEMVLQLAQGAIGTDPRGLKAEFIQLVEIAAKIKGS